MNIYLYILFGVFALSGAWFTFYKIAEKIGMSRATVTRALAKLVEIGAIQRVGSDKSGHWEIVENGE